MMNIKPLAKLTRLLAILLRVNIGLLVLAVLVGVYGVVEYSKLAPGVDPNETLLPSDVANAVVGLVQFLLGIFLGITFLRWIYRVNANLHVLSQQRMVFSPGWSVGWYFIPIANLFKPYQAMREIWSLAHRETSSGGLILGWWWFLWIVSNFLGRVALKLALRAKDAQGYTHSAAAYAVSDALDIALNVVALMLIMAIAKAYTANYVEPGAAPNDGPATPLPSSGVSGGLPSVR